MAGSVLSHGFTAARHPVRGSAPSPRSGHLHLDIELQWWDLPVTLVLGGRIVPLPARTLVAFWAGSPHHLLPAGTSDALPTLNWLTVPVDLLATWNLPAAFLAAVLDGGILTAPWPGDEAGRRLAEWSRLLGSGTFGKTIAALEVQALLWRLHRDGRPVADGAYHGVLSPVVVRALATVLERFREGLDAAAIARHVGCHHKYLLGAFRSATGTTLLAYQTALRLAEAQRLLATTPRGLLDITMASGFGSACAFHRAFRRHLRTTPDAWRRRHRT